MPRPEIASLPPRDRARPWVAVVDDDASIRNSLARLCSCHGIRAETFSSAEDFLQRGATRAPVCIILDVHLGPGLTGFELHDRLKSDGCARPTIFVTGRPDVIPFGPTASDVVCAFLWKPVDGELLMALVRAELRDVDTDMAD
jgi:two-component system, LuxR family, response regulator FixJ